MANERAWVPIHGLEGFPRRLCACGSLRMLDLKVGAATKPWSTPKDPENDPSGQG